MKKRFGKSKRRESKPPLCLPYPSKRRSCRIAPNVISDAAILQSAEVIEYDEYADNHAYNTVGEIIKHNGRYYEIKAAHTSNAAAYPVETTFAYYRLIELSATGTLDDPIPYPETAGIVVNVVSGLYYSYKGAVYLAKADMPNCVYPPDTAGLWQWEKVT